MHFHIILTEKCNSRCKYCFEKSMNEFENGLDKKWEFDLDAPIESVVEIEKLKSFLEKDENPTLIFYGGEPLLKIEKIKDIIDNVNARFCLQTNGKLLDKIPEKYLKKLSKILVSIDGDEKITDFNKGEGAYKKVIENIKKIRRKGFNGEIVARMTIAQDFPDIEKQVKHLIELGIFDSMHWQIDAGFYKNDFNEKEFSKFVESYNKSVSKLIDYWINEMEKGNVIKLYPFLGLYDNLYYEKKSKLMCGAGYTNYTITTNGNLVACPIMGCIKDFYCGNLDSKIKDLKKIYVGVPCTDCEYLDNCGGRCLYSNYAKLWPRAGEKLICKTVIHLIEEIKGVLPEIKKLIKEGKIKESDFEYEKYFGPEIIP
ncbi:MAG: TIGR04084 family radical SAM/SPASM domain-containing protein [Candidatus Pacearchaeota archaeon]|jgi:putative peptide-modifying radical SAM enzyme